MQAELSELVKTLRDNWELDIQDTFSEQEILLQLGRKLSRLLERNPEEFFQLLYRIDIPEHKLNNVLQQTDALDTLAKMIYDRQLEKVKSRQQYKRYFDNDKADGELRW